MSINLSSIRGVVLDMDGVLWRGSELVPGALEFLRFLSERGIPYGLATNNSTRTVAEYVSRCHSFGFDVAADQIITSSVVTGNDLVQTHKPGSPIYVIGSASLADMLVGLGYEIDPERAEAVIVGLDVHLTYEKLAIALRRLLAGADFIGTNADATFPMPDGLAPGAGSIVASLATASGRQPRLMGKPQPRMFEVTVERLRCSAQQTLMIGDRLDTDIAGAQLAGLKAALVLTGVSQRVDIGEIQPDGVYEDLVALQNEWSDLIG